MNKREKRMIAALVALFIILSVKSILIDEVKPANKHELKFKQFVEKKLEDGSEHLGLLYRVNLANFKVVAIQKTSEEGRSNIVYYDEVKKAYVEGTIPGIYKAKVRGYFLYIFPYKEFYVKVGPGDKEINS